MKKSNKIVYTSEISDFFVTTMNGAFLLHLSHSKDDYDAVLLAGQQTLDLHFDGNFEKWHDKIIQDAWDLALSMPKIIEHRQSNDQDCHILT